MPDPVDDSLRLVHGFEPGLARVGKRRKFTYFDADGAVIEDPIVLERIRDLGVPPAWTAVWIASDPNAHLQATGFDSRGRKQYRYHAAWRHERDEVKFQDMESFGRAQPLLRQRINRDLNSGQLLGHRRVLALALRLLDVGLFRVGSDRYARDNEHYGLTTLHVDQVVVRNGQAVFDYVGKAGKRQRLSISDPQAVVVLESLRRRRSGPRELMAFRGTRGWRRIHSEDVNNFLRAESGGPFSAKEYRTWNATVIAAATLADRRPAVARAAGVASKAVADALGNTPVVARRSYIDPRIFERYASGSSIELDGLPPDPWPAREGIESRVLKILASPGAA